MGVRKQAQISPPPFFCGCRLSAAAAESHPPPAAAKIHRCRRRSAVRAPAAATAKSTFAAGVQLFGLQQRGRGQQNGRRWFSCSGSISEGEGSKTAADVQLVGVHQRGRGQQNGRRWFSCSGSSSEGEGSKTAAGVQLVGLQQGGNVKERKRENPIFAAGKIMPWPSVALIDPSHRPQIKGAGGGRRRRKKRRAAGRKTAL